MDRKTIVVTGASRGIGRAIAKRMVADGYHVLGTYRVAVDSAEELEGEMEDIRFFQVDFSQQDQVGAWIETLSTGTIYGIVHNAGIFLEEDIENYDMDSWRKVMQVNLDAIMQITMGLQHKLTSGGAIVNIASTDGLMGAYDSFAYAASKAALINLTQSFALHFGPRNIRANCISPGWIQTDMVDDTVLSASIDYTPLGRIGRPEEVASVVSFLMSREASFVNGVNILVDGGNHYVDPVLKLEFEGRDLSEG